MSAQPQVFDTYPEQNNDDCRFLRNFFAAILSQAMDDAINETIGGDIREEAQRWLIREGASAAQMIADLGGPLFPLSQWLARWEPTWRCHPAIVQRSSNDITYVRELVVKILDAASRARVSRMSVEHRMRCHAGSLKRALVNDQSAAWLAKTKLRALEKMAHAL